MYPLEPKNSRYTQLTSEDIMVICDIVLDNFHHYYRIATAFTFASDKVKPDVKSCVNVFFTSSKIQNQMQTGLHVTFDI
jgi:hypothetical protein